MPHQHVLWALSSKYTLNMTISHNYHHFTQSKAIPFLDRVCVGVFYFTTLLPLLSPQNQFFYPVARVITSKCKLDHISSLLKLSSGFPSLSESSPIFLPYIQCPTYLSISSPASLSLPPAVILTFLLFFKHTKFFPISILSPLQFPLPTLFPQTFLLLVLLLYSRFCISSSLSGFPLTSPLPSISLLLICLLSNTYH